MGQSGMAPIAWPVTIDPTTGEEGPSARVLLWDPDRALAGISAVGEANVSRSHAGLRALANTSTDSAEMASMPLPWLHR
jgi:hypothetical protein